MNASNKALYFIQEVGDSTLIVVHDKHAQPTYHTVFGPRGCCCSKLPVREKRGFKVRNRAVQCSIVLPAVLVTTWNSVYTRG